MAQDLTQITVTEGETLEAVPTPNVTAENTQPIQLADATDMAIPGYVKGVGAAPSVKAETYQVVVKAPADKGMLAYLVGPGAEIYLKDIDLSKATVTEEAGNLRITTASGGEVLLLDYVNSAQNSHTKVITDQGTMPANKLLSSLNEEQMAAKLADIEPAAGPSSGSSSSSSGGVGGEGGGIAVPTILGTGVGSGIGVFSEVIDPFALPIPYDRIETREFPFELGRDPLPPVSPPVAGNQPPFARNDMFSTAQDRALTLNPNQILRNDTDPENDALTIVSVQGATHGTVSIVNGQVVFVPEAGFTGTGSFSYTITDGHGGTSTADVLVQIDPDPSTQNNVIAADDAYTVPESGRSIVMNVLGNDSDPEGDALVPGSVRIVTPPSVGTATVNPDGTISYQSVPSNTDYFVTLTYEVRDARGAADTATVTIEVKATNSVDAIDDTGEILPAGASKAFNVVANDIDPQGDAFAITRIVSGPTRGSASFNPATGTIVYNSVASATGYTETIVYEIRDARGAIDTATLTVRVEPTNNVVATDDTADLIAGQDVKIDVLRNDSDPQGDAYHITSITQQPRDAAGNPRGSVTINPDGTITFTDTPGAREAGVVEFRYNITDARGAVDEAVVRVTIGTAPNGVDANNDTLQVNEDSPRTEITTLLRANDFDAQGDTFTITSITPVNPAHGTVELVNGHVFFTPAPGYHGPATFTYTITDSKGATDTAQVTINVTETPDGLMAGDDAFSTPFNTNITITPAQLLVNDVDPDGSVLTSASIISFTQPTNGTVTRLPNGEFVYNPNDTFRGTDTFTYTIRDGQGEETTATVTIRVADPVQTDNPVDAVNDNVTLAPGETRTINVLTNDSAPDGGLQFVRVVGTLPAGVTDLGNGQFSYTAPANTTGQTLTFQYEVRDADGDTDIATVTIDVRGAVNTVIANDDTATLVRSAANNAVDSILINVEANDTDPNGDTFDTTGNFTQPAIGSVTRNADGSFTYTADPAHREAYTTTFTYEIRDARGAVDTATVTVNVGADYNTVDAINDTTTLTRTAAGGDVLINVEANDVDPQGDAFDTTLNFTQPGIGSVTRNADGSFTYHADPAHREAYSTTFTYEIRDALGAVDTATVTVNVAAAPNSVDAINDTATLVRNTANNAVDSILINVEANDTDPQGDAFDTTLNFTQPGIGSVTRNADGSFTYTADPAHTEAYSTTFTYEIRDALGAVDTATVTINVGADWVAPNTVDARDDTAGLTRTGNGGSVLINVEANDVDPQGDAFDTTLNFTQPAIGSVVRNADGSFTYNADPAHREAYSTTFTYEIRDARGAVDTATVTVNVAAAPNNVVANDDYATTADMNAVRINVRGNDVDPQGDSFTVTSFTQPTYGTAYFDAATQTFLYQPNPIYARLGLEDTFTYTITDRFGATSTATVHVTNTITPTDTGDYTTSGDGGDAGGGDGCPLVIDLDNDGITLTSLASSNAHFDLNADVNSDGFAEHTAWYGAREGILAMDYNGNGTIDNVNEVYGGTNIDGYSELRALEDTNHDNVIDASDANFGNLRIWLDSNQDGISQADELHTLTELGVRSIQLNATEVNNRYEDAYISHMSTVEMTDGTTRTTGSVFFTNEGNGHVVGSSRDDVMVYSATADSIDGGQGFDTLRVMSGSDITIGHDVSLSHMEAINLANNMVDHLTINVADVLNITDGGVLAITGDAVDAVNLTGDYTQGANVSQGGHTFASYTAGNGAQLLVELGVTVHEDPAHAPVA